MSKFHKGEIVKTHLKKYTNAGGPFMEISALIDESANSVYEAKWMVNGGIPVLIRESALDKISKDDKDCI